MDFRERFGDQVDAIKTAMSAQQLALWTAMPGIIQDVDLSKTTCTVQPAIQGIQTKPTGKRENVDLPLLVDVPIVWPRGGDYTLTFPVKKGDECLIVFASRCIDNWWQAGGVQPQFEQRLHDLSDGFAILGPFSQKTKIDKISDKTTQLRSDDGTRFVEIDTPNKKVRSVTDGVSVELDSTNKKITSTTDGVVLELDSNSNKVTVTAPVEMHVECPLLTLSGSLRVSGTITGGYGTGDQVGLQTHTHTQPNDSRGDAQQPVRPPTAGT